MSYIHSIPLTSHKISALFERNFLYYLSDSWYPDELNDGQAEYLFFLLAGIMAVNFAVFVVVAKCYKYKTDYGDSQGDDLPPVYETIPPGNPPANSPNVSMTNPMYKSGTDWQLNPTYEDVTER